MDRIIVTGANGFVGQHLVRELLAHDYDVLAIGGSQVKPLEGLTEETYMTLDLMNPEETAKIEFKNVVSVIHLAGLAAVGPSFDKPMEYMDTNVRLEVNLFETALRQQSKPRFIIVSSSSLYDPNAQQPLTEESPVLPNSPYAVSKLSQEQMALYYKSLGIESVIARPFNHIGPGQSPGFIVPDLAQQIVNLVKESRQVITVGNLDAKRDYTDVRDIVRAYRLLIEKGRSGEVYNICSGKPISGHDLLEGLCGAAEVNPEIHQDVEKMRPSDTASISGSYKKLEADTGWQPEIPLETTLADVIVDWRSRS